MTVRQAYYISIAVHIMVFGSAFAIAQYGRGLFLSSGDTIKVDLVSPGSTSDNGMGAVSSRNLSVAPRTNEVGTVKNDQPAEPTRDQVDIAMNDQLAMPTTNQVYVAKNEKVADVHTGSEMASMRVSSQITKNADSGIDDPGLYSSASGDGRGVTAQFGTISSEEWANLSAAIERTKNYPRLARERGIEGVVRVRFRLTSSGNVEKIEIVQSSGSEILDSASISAVYRAAPMPHVSGWIEIPMKYVLK